MARAMANQFLFLVMDSIFKPPDKITRRRLGPFFDLETSFRQLQPSICLKLSQLAEQNVVFDTRFDIVNENWGWAQCFSSTHFTDRCRQGIQSEKFVPDSRAFASYGAEQTVKEQPRGLFYSGSKYNLGRFCWSGGSFIVGLDSSH